MKKFCEETLVVSTNLHGQIEIEMQYGDRYGFKYLTRDEALSMGSYLIDEATRSNQSAIKGIDIDHYIGREISDFYCNGFFGRRYDLTGSEIIAIGDRWLVVRTTSGEACFAHFESRMHLESKLAEWV